MSKNWDIFLIMKVLENTPAVLSLGKLCDEDGYSYEWINSQKPHLIKNGIWIQCNTENFVPIVVPGLSSSSSGFSSTSKTPSRQESVKFRLENEKIALTSLQCKCQIRLMIDQGDLMIPKPIKPKNK